LFIPAEQCGKKVPAPTQLFFAVMMEPEPVNGFNGLARGSMSLIFLHHLLFNLDPQLRRQFYYAKSHISLQIRARSRLEETL
jgi:hypothetical protein